MNPVFKAAAESNELGGLMGVMTVLFLSAFLYWVWWAWRPDRRVEMERWGRLPLEDDGQGGEP